MNPVKNEIKTRLAEAVALEREPARPGENVSKDSDERRHRIPARCAALEARARVIGTGVTTALARNRRPGWAVVRNPALLHLLDQQR